MAGFGAASIGGAVDMISDGEVPRSFTGRARTVISGGQFVTVSGAANVVGSTVQNFIPGSIVFDLIAGGNYAVGIALHNVGSNGVLSVATRGVYIVTSADIISGGVGVYPFSGPVQGVKSIPIDISYSGTQVGRALTAAASGTNIWTLVNFSF